MKAGIFIGVINYTGNEKLIFLRIIKCVTEINEKILEEPINKLSFSDDLKNLLVRESYNRLADVLKKEISFIRKKVGISFEQELELFKLVEKNGLESYWKEK